MLYVFGFTRTGVVISDLFFIDPQPGRGQEGAEHGVRLEVRLLERGQLPGSIYSAQPIRIGRPVWRADLLESVAGRPGATTARTTIRSCTAGSPGRGCSTGRTRGSARR